jgi:alkaline phosphatase D
LLSAGLAIGVLAGAAPVGAPPAAGASSGAVPLGRTGALGRRDLRPTAAAPALGADPFTLGVASGDPRADGFVIWTRLAPSPLEDDGLGGMPSRWYPVWWEVAHDARFRHVVRRGVAVAGPESGHAVHVEVTGLEPAREHHYRFAVHRWRSPVGRALTAPAPAARATRLTMAFASCSNYPAGFFTAYRHLAEEWPDLVLHLGDYVYEGAAAPNELGRPHVGPETVTLANYRQRHALYKTDPDLQRAHAAAPWVVVWDDHEVDDNYAGDVPDEPTETPTFPERRAAAYRAYFENMPLRRLLVPPANDFRLYRRLRWGRLATFHMLDTRQYRDDQACEDGFKECPGAAEPARSLLGVAQERWLCDGFRCSETTWDLLGQQVFFSRRDRDETASTRVSMDAWDGYPASRERLLRCWRDADVRNPVVLTGDVHASWACDVVERWEDRESDVIGSELVATSVSSGGDGYDEPHGIHPWAAWNPHIRFWTNLRGYVRTVVTSETLRADFRCVDQVTNPDSAVFTRRGYVIEDRVRGLRQVYDNPRPPGSPARKALPDARGIVEDTLRAERGPDWNEPPAR